MGPYCKVLNFKLYLFQLVAKVEFHFLNVLVKIPRHQMFKRMCTADMMFIFKESAGSVVSAPSRWLPSPAA